MSVDPTMHVQQELACGTRGKSSWSQDPGLHFLAACVMQDRSARSFSVQTPCDTQSWLTSGTRSKEQLMLPVANARLKRSLRYRLTGTQHACWITVFPSFVHSFAFSDQMPDYSCQHLISAAGLDEMFWSSDLERLCSTSVAACAASCYNHDVFFVCLF